jgi:hypothetical protein
MPLRYQIRRTGQLGDWQVIDTQTNCFVTDLQGQWATQTVADQMNINDAADKFPAEFGLRAFQGMVFRVNREHSFIQRPVSGPVIQLYLQTKRGEAWVDFAKGTVSELLREVVKL